MKIKISIPFLLLTAVVTAQPIMVPNNFLNTAEPERMCNNYVRQQYGQYFTAFAQPTGGALLRVEESGPQVQDRCLYIFCDAPLHRLLIYSLIEQGGTRTPRAVKGYGIQVEDPFWDFEPDSTTTHFSPPRTDRTPVGCLDRPIDVALSSCGRHFDPDNDYVYVLDQANHRIVKLAYDIALDSLIWVTSFGSENLMFPTALDYADYGDANYGNDDIYVLDPGRSGILRFSTSGVYETSYSGWGSGLASVSYPSGIAVSTSPSYPKRFYVTDSHNHRIVRYYAESDGPIIAEKEHIFPLSPWPLINSIDTDAEGNVYVLDTFNHYGIVLSASLDSILTTFGGQGYEPGEFDSPSDIYIDGHEMQICELFADSSGIQSLTIVPGSPKKEPATIPGEFSLAQNYPNPFNSSTTIMFELPEAGPVRIDIYNILGQRVMTLADEQMSAGKHSRIWNGANRAGETVSSGVYFYVLQSDNHVATKKLLLLK